MRGEPLQPLQAWAVVFVTNRFFSSYNFKQLKKLSDRFVFYAIVLQEQKQQIIAAKQEHYFKQIHVAPAASPLIPGVLQADAVKSAIFKIVSHASKLTIICNDDVNMQLAAELRSNYRYLADRGLTCRQAQLFSDKLANKHLLRTAGVNVPAFTRFSLNQFKASWMGYYNQLVRRFGPKLILKPFNAASSRGLVICHNISDFQNLETKSSLPLDNYEVESYVDGTLYHCDSVVNKGKIIFSVVAEYNRPMGEFLQGTAIGSLTLPDDDIVSVKIQAFAHDILRKLGMPDGASHMEIFRDPYTNKLTFLEVAARCPGGLAIASYKKQYGFDMLYADFCVQVGKAITQKPIRRLHAFWALFPYEKGRVSSVSLPWQQVSGSRVDEWKIKQGQVLAHASRDLSEIALATLIWDGNAPWVKARFAELAEIPSVVSTL
tara:strand:+ start:82762 stop:84060 length:1299 start_codon:yes stop_codon:yes gene_type:complete